MPNQGERRRKRGGSSTADRVLARLIDDQNEIAADDQLAAQLRGQVDRILAAVKTTDPTNRARQTLPSKEDQFLGGARAQASIHPSASLRAAAVVFEEILADALPLGDTIPRPVAVATAIALQDRISATLAAAAVGYVDNLLSRLTTVHREERTALSRRLHDDTAQGIAAALQRLEMAPIPEPQVKQILRDILDTVRSTALDLRQQVGPRRLDEAIEAWIADLGTTQPAIRFENQGQARNFQDLHQEEAFMITREATLNALTHAQAEEILIRIAWGVDHLQITINDDGRGFDPAHGNTRMGLLIARERAESIGASLEIESSPTHGTTLRLRIQQ